MYQKKFAQPRTEKYGRNFARQFSERLCLTRGYVGCYDACKQHIREHANETRTPIAYYPADAHSCMGCLVDSEYLEPDKKYQFKINEVDMDTLCIPVIVGTSRAHRKSIHVAKLVHAIGEQYENIESQLVDPIDFNFPGDGNDPEGKDPRYSEITKRADGFFIVVPEYNHSFPGTLKRMLDSEMKNYIHKPVAFAGVSSGPWGGVRAIEALVTIVREMGMVSTFTDVQFPKVQDIFDESGKLLDKAYSNRVVKSYDELVWMAKVLKHGRHNLPSQYHSEK